jgi:O-antigen/teichoic acid export membrane protein
MSGDLELRKQRNRACLLGASTAIGLRLTNLLGTLASSYFLLPYLGAPTYGLWATLISLCHLFTLGNLGLGLGLTTKLASCREDDEKITVATSGLLMSIAMSLILASGVLLLQNYQTVIGTPYVTTPDASKITKGQVLLWAAAGGSLAIILNTGSSILSGLQKTHIDNLLKIPAGLGFLITVFFLPHSGYQPREIFAITALLTTTTALLPCAWAITKGYVRFQKKHIKPAIGRHLLALGTTFFILQLCTSLIQQTGTVLVANSLSPADAAKYDIAWKLSIVPLSISSIAYSALWPAMGDAIKATDIGWLKRVLWNCCFLTFIIWIPFGFLSVVFGPPIIGVIFKGQVTPPKALVVFIALTVLIRSIQIPFSLLLNAAGCTRFTFLGLMLQTFAFILLTYFLFRPLGATAIPAAEFISHVTTLFPITLLGVKRKLSELNTSLAHTIPGNDDYSPVTCESLKA